MPAPSRMTPALAGKGRGARARRVSPVLISLAAGAFCEVFDLGDGKVLKAFFDADIGPDADPSRDSRIAFASAKVAYGWSDPVPGSENRRFYAVLHTGPVASPEQAVRAAIVSDYRQRGAT